MPSVGSQMPAHRYCADYELTEGKFAVQMANKYGLKPHPWQCMVLDDWLAVENGKLVNSLCLLPIPRQNGKTGVSDPRETWGLVWRGEQILHTAQEFQTAQKAFNRLRKKFGMCKNDPMAEFPELNALVDRYTTSANQMVLDLKNGGHIEFRTRGNNSDMGRGGTFDLVVIDEAQSYTDEQDAALAPLNSAAPSGSPQTILMGTVPDPRKIDKGYKFMTMRDALIETPYKGACIHEWSVDEIGDVFDKSRWYAANPSLGYQLLESGLEKDAKTMSEDAFAREHLGWWPPALSMTANIFDPQAWDACATDDEPSGTVCYGVKLSPDGSEAALSACWQGDVPHFELVDYRDTRRGVGWLADWLDARADKCAMLAVDGRNADALTSRLESYRAKQLHVMRTSDAIAAAALMLDGIRSGKVTHYGQAELDEQAKAAIRRKVGRDAWCIGGDHSTAIESAACALWAAKNAKYKPGRKARIG